MTRTLDAITEAVRNPKHPFRKTDHHPTKSLKHRYERRKAAEERDCHAADGRSEYLHLGEWLEEEVAMSRAAWSH